MNFRVLLFLKWLTLFFASFGISQLTGASFLLFVEAVLVVEAVGVVEDPADKVLGLLPFFFLPSPPFFLPLVGGIFNL